MNILGLISQLIGIKTMRLTEVTFNSRIMRRKKKKKKKGKRQK